MSFDDSAFAEFVCQIFDEVWTGKNFDAIATYLHDDAQVDGLVPGMVLDRDAYRDAVEQYLMLCRLEHYDILETFTDGVDRGVVRMRTTLTLLATGKTGAYDVVVVIKMRGPRASRMHVVMDLMSFFEGTGTLPENAAFICLTGTKLT